METLILSSQDVGAIVRHIGLDQLMDEMIERLIKAFQSFDETTTTVPLRSGFEYNTPATGLLEWMPVMRNNTVTLKIVGYHPTNPTVRNLPTIISTVSAYDTRTGHWTAVADGTFLTALRTGAASAVASRYLASEQSRVVGIIGAGAQAVTQLHALSRLFNLEAAIVYDIDPQVTRSFPQRTAFLNLDIVPVGKESLDFLLQTADILCTCTSTNVGQGPIFQDTEVKPWLHVNAVGSDFAGKVELPVSLLKRSLVCPDFLEQAIVEGECQQLLPQEIGPILVEVVKQPQQYAHIRQALSVFDSTGWALEDMVALEMITDYAGQLGIGATVPIESISADPRNPYAFISANGYGAKEIIGLDAGAGSNYL